MTAITLSQDQQAGYEAFASFIMNPHDTVFVLSGYSGTGKTTLVRTLLERLPKLFKMARLLDPNYPVMDIRLTATTNKAAEAFQHISNSNVDTIHSALGLRVHTDYSTGKTRLIPKSHDVQIENTILFIDEASFMDSDMLRHTFKLTSKCKIVLIGDPAQLLNVGSTSAPAFSAGFPEFRLTQVVRQAAGNPIIDLSTKFRETVDSGEFFSFQPDGHYIQHLDRQAFGKAIEDEFLRPDWRQSDSRVLTWTNKSAIHYNHAIRDSVKGNPNFQDGDYAICNSYISRNRYSIKTDQMVCITKISRNEVELDTPGAYYTVNNSATFFMPDSLELKKQRIKEAKSTGNAQVLQKIDSEWIDLRAAYACTINKAQGSTFRKVFIDLDDLKRCTNGNQLARLMYVGVSRASEQVILTGDLV